MTSIKFKIPGLSNPSLAELYVTWFENGLPLVESLLYQQAAGLVKMEGLYCIDDTGIRIQASG